MAQKCIGCSNLTDVDELTPIHHFYCASFGSHGYPFQAYESTNWDEHEDPRQEGGICKECMSKTPCPFTWKCKGVLKFDPKLVKRYPRKVKAAEKKAVSWHKGDCVMAHLNSDESYSGCSCLDYPY